MAAWPKVNRQVKQSLSSAGLVNCTVAAPGDPLGNATPPLNCGERYATRREGPAVASPASATLAAARRPYSVVWRSDYDDVLSGAVKRRNMDNGGLWH